MITKKKECNGCHQEKYIYKNVTIDGTRYKLCKDCTFKKDIKVKPSKLQIKKVSDKKKALDVMYSKLRKIHLEKYAICEIRTKHCSKSSTEIHHSAGRLSGNYLKISTWFATCRECHNWVHLNPQIARELNFLK